MKDINLLVRLGLRTGLIRQSDKAPSPSAAKLALSSAISPATGGPQAPTSAGASQPQHTVAPSSVAAAHAPFPPSQSSDPGATVAAGTASHSPSATVAPSAMAAPAPEPSAPARGVPVSVQPSAPRMDVLPARPVEAEIGTVMPAAAKFTGNMEIEESIVLQCVVRGDVTQTGPHSVILGSAGGIHGTLRATTAVIAGTIEGDVIADEVIILETGVIRGNVQYAKLAVEEGAVINGTLRMVVPNVIEDGASIALQEKTLVAPDATHGPLHAVPRVATPFYGAAQREFAA